MTPEEEMLKTTIFAARQKMFEVEYDYNFLLDQCNHTRIIKKNDSAVCEVCNKYFGWWCPKSSDNTCYYYSNTEDTNCVRFVELRNGRKFILTKELGDIIEADFENNDCCLFCHQPSERK